MADFKTILKAAAKSAAIRRMSNEARQLPTPRTVREPSSTERNVVYLPANYGLLFCIHGKSYFDICSNCKRDRKLARVEYQAFCKRHGLE